MSTTAALVIAIVATLLIASAFSKPAKTLVGGIFMRDKKGRLVLILTPTPKPRRRGRRQR
ncbi:hypothetical protein [Pseudonocardia sp. TRM90224]|uniref:hypothetical protein n=1 Tax=Pseudonocardia sp. TRM90224 TaxID=2812678 RepID=UPI001E5E6CDA|nr:hypothetical protein [Pseudonocardia sp. TRM90224]